MTTLTDDLRRPEAYPAPRPARIELRETHASSVFLTERDVYKIKKRVRFGFLDYSTKEARRRACEAEVRLNRRLAPSVYLGVVPVFRGRDGQLGFVAPDDAREPEDWAVHMRRLPDDLRADRMLAEGRLSEDHVERLADHVTTFHARAAVSARIGRHGSAEAIRQNVRDNFSETWRSRHLAMSEAEVRAIERWQLAFCASGGESFEVRRERGFVRDVHGDLRLEHVYFDVAGGDPSGITVVDCLEFSDRLRCSDVCSDVAFLSMDFAAHGRVDLAEHWLARYARATDDYDLYALVDFYESYRAFVRGKVALLRAEAVSEGDDRRHAVSEARRHFLLALAGGRRALLPPAVVCVGGVIASGKSTLASALGRRLSAPVVDADRTRKSLLHVAAESPLHVPAFEGAYDPKVTSAVYAELLHRAGVVVASGRPVVVDASFRAREMRLAARELARVADVPFVFVECRAEPSVCLGRLARRARGRSVSDGRAEIFADFLARWEDVHELAADEHVVVDTAQPLGTSVATASRHLPIWPEGLVA